MKRSRSLVLGLLVLASYGHAQDAVTPAADSDIQHNPLAASGRDGVVRFFTEVVKVKPIPVPEKMKSKIVSVVAEGDLVTVAYVRELKDPKDPAMKAAQ